QQRVRAVGVRDSVAQVAVQSAARAVGIGDLVVVDLRSAARHLRARGAGFGGDQLVVDLVGQSWALQSLDGGRNRRRGPLHAGHFLVGVTGAGNEPRQVEHAYQA